MVLVWDGEPVSFNHTVSYQCDSADVYFEMDKEMEEWNMTCNFDGSWEVPDVWPICLNCKYDF